MTPPTQSLHHQALNELDTAISHIPALNQKMHEQEYKAIQMIAQHILDQTNTAIQGLQVSPSLLNRIVLSSKTGWALLGFSVIVAGLSLYTIFSPHTDSIEILANEIAQNCIDPTNHTINVPCIIEHISNAVPIDLRENPTAISQAIFSITIAIISALRDRANNTQQYPVFKESFLKEMILFKNFLEDFVRFGEKRDENSLQQCITSYNSLSTNKQNQTQTKQLGAKEKWIWAMVQILPDESPLKKTYQEIIVENSPLSETQTTPITIPPPALDFDREEFATPSNVHASSLSQYFPQRQIIPIDSSQNREALLDVTPLEKTNTVIPKYTKWLQLEQQLGTPINYLFVDQQTILCPNDIKSPLGHQNDFISK